MCLKLLYYVFQIELAFAYAYSISKSNGTIYQTDFEADKVKEVASLYNSNPLSWSTEYPLEEKLSEVHRLSKFQ
jgi:hypothetical protein